MSSIYGSLFAGGHWEWDDEKKGILLVSQTKAIKKLKAETDTLQSEKTACRRANLELRFTDTLDPKEMATFRQVIMRHAKLFERDVVTQQDVRDVALFQCVSTLPLDLIDLLHTLAVDCFLRALLVYMQHFIQTVNNLQNRHCTRAAKLLVGELTHVEQRWQRDLCDLRTLLARAHCALLLATEPGMERFHHLEAGKGGVTSSQGERDIRYYELLWRLSARMVYIALGRPSQGIIEAEMNRLFRSPIFSGHIGQAKTNAQLEAPDLKGSDIDTPVNPASSHIRSYEYYQRLVLFGPEVEQQNKFQTRSPAALAVLGDVDYRLMASGQVDFGRNDERLNTLWDSIILPSELLVKRGIPIGILGMPRCNYDPMLVPLQSEEQAEEPMDLAELSLLDSDKQGEDEQALPGLVLPPPGPRVPAPDFFPETTWELPEEERMYEALRAKDREAARRRWRRWIIGGSRRRQRHRMSNATNTTTSTVSGASGHESQASSVSAAKEATTAAASQSSG